MNTDVKKRYLKIFKRFLIVVLVLIIIFTPLFIYFNIKTKSRLMYREAKNVRIAISAIDTSYYAKGGTIYDPKRVDGMVEGAQKDIRDLSGMSGHVTLTGYSKKTNEVTSFEYEEGSYRVTYNANDEDAQWKVEYILPVLKYDAD